jgi:hypothetical protein
MSKQLIVCASNWSSFVASLKSNLKLNYGVCNKTEFRNGFFTASLSQGKDKSYIAKLTNMSGEEKENCHELCTFLGSNFTLNVGTIPEKVVQEIKSAIVDYAMQEVGKEAVATTIKRVPRKAKEKK